MPIEFNIIQALVSQTPINDLMQIKDIVDKEIQFCRDNMHKQAAQQAEIETQELKIKQAEVERRRATPRYAVNENQLRGAQAGIREIDPVDGVYSNEKLHVSESGATSSHVPLRYDLIPRSLVEIAAERYTKGAIKHGERGYQKGLEDWEFILNRINHITEHWNKLFHSADDIDEVENPKDHLGAILWGIGFLCELTEHEKGKYILGKILELGKVRRI